MWIPKRDLIQTGSCILASCIDLPPYTDTMFTMAVVIAMLRGVNVGGHQKLNMEALRTLCAGLGLRDVETYIQSGNVVFREDGGDPGMVARKIEDGIERKFGFRPDVIVRTTSELRKVIAG